LKREIEKLASKKVSPVKKLAKRKEKFDPTTDLKYHDPCHVNTSDKVDANGPVKSIMDRMALDKEKPEVRDAIIAKSKRIGVSYNKGPYVLQSLKEFKGF
jgi:Fe-S oxidoreductase